MKNPTKKIFLTQSLCHFYIKLANLDKTSHDIFTTLVYLNKNCNRLLSSSKLMQFKKGLEGTVNL